MKKQIAIALLVIHLFNLGGQLAFYQYLVYKSDRFFNEQVSKNLYNVDDLTEIKIPANIKNVPNVKGYVNLSGEVRFANASYNYVKIKVTQKAIYLMCIPHYSTTHLAGRNIIYARQIKDIPVPRKEHVPFGKISIMDYNFPTVNYMFGTPQFALQKKKQTDHSLIPNSCISGPGQPPDWRILVS